MKTVLLDAGHGGIIDGVYVTPGKRSPVWSDGKQLFEGVFNRQVVAKIKSLLAERGIPFVDVVDSEQDVPLAVRVKRANDFHKTNPDCIYVSVHGNAAGNGVDNNPASGLEVFTSKGQTKSDILASLVIDELEALLPGVKFRKDIVDNDEDKEENFYVLRETSMPAILSENGFMTNFEDCKKMMSEDFQWKLAHAHVNGIQKFINLK